MGGRTRLAVPGAFIVALLLIVSTPRIAHADSPETEASTLITLQAPGPGESPGSLLIAALLTGEGGQPLDGQRIDFFVDVDFPGAERLYVGTKTTDATGKATIRYRPSWDGTHVVTARSQGGRAHPSATAEMSFEVSGAATTYVEAQRSLGPLRDRLPLATGALVLVVWATLAFITVRTVLGIARAGAARPG